jgi:hypothetical protein
MRCGHHNPSSPTTGLTQPRAGRSSMAPARCTLMLPGRGTVSFWWKVSAETNIDAFRFYVGGALVAEITGSVDWEQRTFEVPAGVQELKWKFKDAGTTGQNRGWLDEVEFVSSADQAARPLSSPLVANITFSGGKVVLTWASRPGNAYQVFYKDSLSETEWKVLDGDVVVTDSVARIEDVVQEQRGASWYHQNPNAAKAPENRAPQRFYQIMEY